MKERAASKIGVSCLIHKLPEETTQAELLSHIDVENRKDSVQGIVLQLPLPRHLDSLSALNKILPEKDVDGLGRDNLGALSQGGAPAFEPCTPSAVIHLLKEYGVALSGKHVAVIGRGLLVGSPLSLLLNKENATVTLCHLLTTGIKEFTRRADIVVAAAGSPRLVTADWIRPGAVVVDVGINQASDGKVVGDVDFDSVSRVASKVSAVPGGVGPLTVATLLRNTVQSAELKCQRRTATPSIHPQ